MGNPEQTESPSAPDPEACVPQQTPAVNVNVVVPPPTQHLPLALLFMVLFTFCLVLMFVPMISYGYHEMLYK